MPDEIYHSLRVTLRSFNFLQNVFFFHLTFYRTFFFSFTRIDTSIGSNDINECVVHYVCVDRLQNITCKKLWSADIFYKCVYTRYCSTFIGMNISSVCVSLYKFELYSHSQFWLKGKALHFHFTKVFRIWCKISYSVMHSVM